MAIGGECQFHNGLYDDGSICPIKFMFGGYTIPDIPLQSEYETMTINHIITDILDITI